jgi:low affinity Fe/Cu permease
MSDSWKYIIIIAVVTTAIITGFQLYNSLTGENREFNRDVFPIQNDLGEDTLILLDEKVDNLYYEGEEEQLQNQ